MFKKGLFLGVVIGAVGGWFATRRYYENQWEYIDCEAPENEEVETIKKELNVKFGKQNVDSRIDRKGPRVNVVDNIKELAPTNDNINEMYPPLKRGDIHVITEAEYDEVYENYDKIELQYFMEENRVSDSDGEDYDINDLIPPEAWDDFCNNESSQFIYVRNNKLEIDFIIEKDGFIDMEAYENVAVMYQEEKQKILDEKNGVESSE